MLGTTATQEVEMLAADAGATVSYENPSIFPIDELRLGSTSAGVGIKKLVNRRGSATQVLYVRKLMLEAGATLDLAGRKLYYLTVSPPNPYAPGSGVTITDSVGGGSLVQAAIATSVEGGLSSTPNGPALSLEQNVPNPFNPETSIAFTAAQAGHVALRIFDIQGELVATLVDGETSAGAHTVRWNGRNAVGESVGNGVYFFRVEGLGETHIRKMTLLK